MERSAFVVKDIRTSMFMVYPVQPKSADEVANATRLSKGIGKIRFFFSDGAPETQRAFRDIGLVREASRRGDPQSNGIIERASQGVIAGPAACLLQAGFPAQFWLFASPCYCRLRSAGAWPWGLTLAQGNRFGFWRTTLALGSRVAYFQPKTRGLVLEKVEPETRARGVQAAPEFCLGGRVFGLGLGGRLGIQRHRCLVIDDPVSCGDPMSRGVLPCTTGCLWFPLKSMCDHAYAMLEGISARLVTHNPVDRPLECPAGPLVEGADASLRGTVVYEAPTGDSGGGARPLMMKQDGPERLQVEPFGSNAPPLGARLPPMGPE